MAPATVLVFVVSGGVRPLSTDRLATALEHKREFGGGITQQRKLAGALETETGRLARTGGEGG